MISSLSRSIKRTIVYGKKYGVIYSREDLFFRLINNKNGNLAKIPIINNPTQKKYYKEKLKKAKKIAKMIALRFKTVRMIGVTGSVAAEYPKKNDDIDLLVVTKKDSLWITRLEIRVWVWLNRIPHRKYNQKQNKDEFCFNLWLEEKSLDLPKNKQNLKNAMDLILMKPMVNKGNTYEKFILENNWAKKYVANGYSKIVNSIKLRVRHKKEKTNILMKVINRILFRLQYLYMKRKFSGEKVDIKWAFFHPEK